MRRGLSILLAILFGVGPLSVVLPGGDEAALPPCCRRHGAHHCAMAVRMAAMLAEAESGKPCASAPTTCPYYPGTEFAMLMPAHALVAIAYRSADRQFRARAIALPERPGAFDRSNPHAGRSPPMLRRS